MLIRVGSEERALGASLGFQRYGIEPRCVKVGKGRRVSYRGGRIRSS